MRILLLGLSLLFSSFTFAQATDDNEIWIDQVGDTLTLYIDQIGFGNKIGKDDFSGSADYMDITGASLTFDLDFGKLDNCKSVKSCADNHSFILNNHFSD